MVLSSGEIITIGSGIQSHINATSAVRHSNQSAGQETITRIPKSNLKFHKVKKNEKYKVSGNLPENYRSDQKVPKTNIENLIKLSSKYKLVSFKLPDETNDYFLKSCYQIDFISSPVRYNGEGTKAIKGLLEKSLSDKETEGRLIVDVKITDSETSAAGFFYKLGFRFTDERKNTIMQSWAQDRKSILSPKLIGFMYLPKDKIQKLMMYRILL